MKLCTILPTARLKANATERRRARECLRALREAKRGNPWDPDNVARRHDARDRLAAGLRLVAGSAPDLVAFAADAAARVERLTLARANADAIAAARSAHCEARIAADMALDEGARADVVATCGHASVAYGHDGEPLEGAGGLIPARVKECGHRLCPLCSRRRAQRSRGVLVERLNAITRDCARSSTSTRADLDAITTIHDRMTASPTGVRDVQVHRLERAHNNVVDDARAFHELTEAREHARAFLAQAEGSIWRTTLRTMERAGATGPELDEARERWQEVRDEARAAAAKAKLWRDDDVRFVTLTVRHRRHGSADAEVSALLRGLARFTGGRWWKGHVAGAFVRIEVERSTPHTRSAKAQAHRAQATALLAAGCTIMAAQKDASSQRLHDQRRSAHEWHAHAHILASVGWVDLAKAKAAWALAMGVGVDDVGIDTARPDGDVRHEAAKYITKGITLKDTSPEDVADLCRALRGRRLTRCTGALRGLRIDEDDDATTEKEGHQSREHVGRERTSGMLCLADDVVWRSDPTAQEARRAALHAAWETWESRRRASPTGAQLPAPPPPS